MRSKEKDYRKETKRDEKRDDKRDDKRVDRRDSDPKTVQMNRTNLTSSSNKLVIEKNNERRGNIPSP